MTCTDIMVKDTVCIVSLIDIRTGGRRIFGVYETEELAKKRVEEQECLISEYDIVWYETEEVWKEKTEKEEEVVKPLRLNGTSLTVNVTKEVREMGLDRRDEVIITLRPKNAL